MVERARIVTLLALALALSGASLAQAHSYTGPGKIDVHKTFSGADTYMFSIRSSEDFNLLNNSRFSVTGYYPTNGTPVQDAGALVGVVRYFKSACVTRAGDDPCLFGMVGDSLEDSSDVQVQVQEPLTFDLDIDPNRAGYASLTAGVQYEGIRGFQKEHASDSFVTFRYFVSVPGAERIDVDIHFHANKPISIRDEVAHDGGILFTGEDYRPDARVNTMAAEAMLEGEVTVQHDGTSGDRFYALQAPSWYGTSVLDGVFVTTAISHNTAALTHMGMERPDGTGTSGTAVAAFGAGGIPVLAATQSGDWRFWVDAHAGAGPQEVYLVGFTGPVAS
ncbi:MAG: hypothetical protein R3185_03890 [Candidatus Thermoplasmatota archaeon]|nr:hypothetical protein [Candidatus Thermoplasmatota archaeon]